MSDNQMVSTLIDDDETEYVKVPKAVANKMRDDAVCYRELWLYSRNQTARLKEYYDIYSLAIHDVLSARAL